MTLTEKRAAIHTQALRLGYIYFARYGGIPSHITEIARATAPETSPRKYNHNHDPYNGEFTSGLGDDGIGDPPIEPVYPVETLLAALTVGEALASVRLLLEVSEGAAGGVEDSISSAAQAIENYLGGPPDEAFPNDAGDMVIMKGNKKIRFGINNPGNDEPHFHIEEEDSGGNWIDAGSEHRYYFGDGE